MSLPVIVSDIIMRGMGIPYNHITIYTSRVIMMERPDMGDDILYVLGTLNGRLCNLPMRTHSPIGATGFRSMCASVRSTVIPHSDTHTSAYAHNQWFAAVLRQGSTVQRGGCTLISLRSGGMLHCRQVEDSLESEMLRMGQCMPGEALSIVPLPEVTNQHNKSMVTLSRVVDNLAICYAASSPSTVVLADFIRLPSQCLDVHRILSYGSEAMLHMRDGFRILWTRSFSIHTCYHVSGDGEILGKLH